MTQPAAVISVSPWRRILDSDGHELDINPNGALSTQFADNATIDAFARLRISNPETTFENTFQYDLNPLSIVTSATGSGSVVHVPAESEAQLSTGGTASGDRAVLQSRKYHRYQPGKSQLVMMTCRMGPPKAAVRQRIGYFDAGNGLFFEQTETGAGVVVRTSTSGSPVDVRVDQANWNIDRLDGTGDSRITLDLSKAQIFLIDFEWLGVGRVRFGFVIDGIPVYCHQILNANTLSTVYMTTPHLPTRVEIENTGTAASLTTMDQYCMSVISEGGFQEDIGNQFAIGRGVTPLGVTARRPVLSIRPRAQFNSIVNRGHVIFKQLEMLATNNSCLWELVLGGTLTGATFNPVDAAYSITEYDVAATVITGGVSVARGFSVAGLGSATGQSIRDVVKNLELYNNFAGTSGDTLSVVCTSFTGTSNINAALSWTEQR